MYVNKEDKNIFIMILAILVVSIIALIAIGNIIWRIISPGISAGLAEVANIIRVNQLDYNFAIPEKKEPIIIEPELSQEPVLSEEEQRVKDMDLNYNFSVSPAKSESVVLGVNNFYEEIAQDYKLGENRSASIEGTIRIIIPKIAFNAQINETMLLHPSSYQFNHGEIALLCTRRNLDSNDPKSCYYMDLVKVNDQIIVYFDSKTIKYKVVKIELFESNYENIYSGLRSDTNSIKIVTTGHLDSGRGRLVITALPL